MSIEEQVKSNIYKYLKQYPIRGFHSKKYRQKLKATKMLYCVCRHFAEQVLNGEL